MESQYSFWFFVIAPLSAFVFYISSLAELERVPFDLPEAESEIVAGWLTETSGMIYGLIQLGTYLKLYVLAALFVILFLGVDGSTNIPTRNNTWIYRRENL